MRRKIVLLGVLLTVVIALSFLAAQPLSAKPEEVIKGPRVDKLVFTVYKNPDAMLLGLKTEEVYTVDWNVPAERIPDIMIDPKLNIITTEDMGMFELSANCKKYPTSITEFRQAISYLVDRERLISEVLKGTAFPLYTPVPPIYKEWLNPAIKPIPYDPEKAAEIFDKLGFKLGPDGKRIDPRTGEPLAPIIVYGRSDDPGRKWAAEQIRTELEKLGFTVDLRLGPPALFWAEVYKGEDWHLSTTGWGLTPDLDYLYWFFSSKAPRVYNFVFFSDPEFDEIADIIYSSPSKEEVLKAVLRAQEILYEKQPYIMLYARLNVNPYNVKWEGYVPAVGSTLANRWTYFNARPAGLRAGGIFKVGLLHGPMDLNPLTAEWVWDWAVLELVYQPLTEIHPYTLEDIPWLADSWSIEERTDGVEGLVITYNLVKGATWYDGKPVTADDVVFTYNYMLKNKPPRWEMAWSIIDKVEKVDDYTVKVYTTTKSYWTFHWVNIVILPKHIWEKVEDWEHYDPWKEDGLTGCGPFKVVDMKAEEYVVFEANRNFFRSPELFMGIRDWLEAPKKVEAVVSAPSEIVVGDVLTVKVAVKKEGAPTKDASVVVKLVDPTGKKVKEVTAKYSNPDKAFVATLDTKGLPAGSYAIEATATTIPLPIRASASTTVTMLSEEFRKIGAALTEIRETTKKSIEDLSSAVKAQSASIAELKSTVATLSGTLNMAIGVAVIALIIGIVGVALAVRKKP